MSEETTIRRALSEAERESLALAAEAARRGDIEQKEIQPGSGVWTLRPDNGERK